MRITLRNLKISLLLGAQLLFFYCEAIHAEPIHAKIKIGVILPLTGGVAAWGKDIQNAILYAQQRLDEKKLEFIFEDDQGIGKNAVLAAHKLIDIDKIDFAMVACSESMLSTGPLFEQHQITVIAPVASAASVSGLGKHIFRTWPSDQLAAKKLYDHLATRYKRVGIVSETRGYSQEFVKAFKTFNTNRAIEIIEDNFADNNVDLKSMLLRFSGKRIDALILNANGEVSLLALVRQIHLLRLSVPLFGTLIPGSRTFQEQSRGLAEGMIYIDMPSTNTFNKEGSSEYELFVSQFGAPETAPFVFASTFEAVRLFSRGIKQEVPLSQFLRSHIFSGVFGEYKFNEFGDITGVTHILRVIEDGAGRDLLLSS